MAVKRYDLYRASAYDHPEMEEFADGEWVRHEDYAALEAKAYAAGVASGKLLVKVQRLEAECERLRAVLEDIKKKGHGDYHGKGYTLASIADRALHKEPS